MKILFISSNRIGDAVLTTGVLGWLQETYPQARFTIVCGPVVQDLFRAFPNTDEIIPLQKQKHHSHWVKLWKRCIGTRWDIIVDLRNSLVSRLLFAKKKYIKPPRPSGRHKVEDHGSLFGLTPPPKPHLPLDLKAETEANKIVPEGGPILALAPAANWAPKSWNIGNFIEVARRITSDQGQMPHARLMVVAAPHERDQVQALLDAFPKEHLIDVIGYDLLTVAACLKKADCFIGNDSGLMHMSAALGVPTLGLFGPSDERIYGPYGPHCLPVRTPETREQLFALQPYPGANTPLLMGTLSIDKVMEGIAKLLNQGKINA